MAPRSPGNKNVSPSAWGSTPRTFHTGPRRKMLDWPAAVLADLTSPTARKLCPAVLPDEDATASSATAGPCCSPSLGSQGDHRQRSFHHISCTAEFWARSELAARMALQASVPSPHPPRDTVSSICHCRAGRWAPVSQALLVFWLRCLQGFCRRSSF